MHPPTATVCHLHCPPPPVPPVYTEEYGATQNFAPGSSSLCRYGMTDMGGLPLMRCSGVRLGHDARNQPSLPETNELQRQKIITLERELEQSKADVERKTKTINSLTEDYDQALSLMSQKNLDLKRQLREKNDSVMPDFFKVVNHPEFPNVCLQIDKFKKKLSDQQVPLNNKLSSQIIYTLNFEMAIVERELVFRFFIERTHYKYGNKISSIIVSDYDTDITNTDEGFFVSGEIVTYKDFQRKGWATLLMHLSIYTTSKLQMTSLVVPIHEGSKAIMKNYAYGEDHAQIRLKPCEDITEISRIKIEDWFKNERKVERFNEDIVGDEGTTTERLESKLHDMKFYEEYYKTYVSHYGYHLLCTIMRKTEDIASNVGREISKTHAQLRAAFPKKVTGYEIAKNADWKSRLDEIYKNIHYFIDLSYENPKFLKSLQHFCENDSKDFRTLALHKDGDAFKTEQYEEVNNFTQKCEYLVFCMQIHSLFKFGFDDKILINRNAIPQ